MQARPWTRFVDDLAGQPDEKDEKAETAETAEARTQATLRAFRRFLLLHACVRSWLWLWFAVDVPIAGLLVPALIASLAFALAWRPRSEWLAPRVLLPALAIQWGVTFPLTDNHFFLELYAAVLLCLLDRRGGDGALVLGALRWLAVIVLFHTGLQKVLYGQYFSGQFLAFMVGQGERFALPFQWILPAGEVARLKAYDALLTGQGPFRVDSPVFLAVSNAVWIAEMGLAGLLVLARTRAFACFAAIALVAAIQLGAREIGFAFLFSSLLLLFTDRGNERALPWLLLVYVGALAWVTLGLPGAGWIEAGSL